MKVHGLYFYAVVLKKKVASLRASLAREIREEQVCSKSGSGKRTTAVYVYTKALSFLRPHMRIGLRPTQDNIKRTHSDAVCILFNTRNYKTI